MKTMIFRFGHACQVVAALSSLSVAAIAQAGECDPLGPRDNLATAAMERSGADERCARLGAIAGWQLDAAASNVEYVSIKADHVAEIASFVADSGEALVLAGSIDAAGQAIFSIDLNEVDSNNDIRDERLRMLLFETDLLPTAYFTADVDMAAIEAMNVGEVAFQTLAGALSVHAVRQPIEARVVVNRVSATRVTVTTTQPVNVDSANFDLSFGIEVLRTVAGLASIGESVPVYFHLEYVMDDSTVAVPMPAAPADPSDLNAVFDSLTSEGLLAWVDNATNETHYLVRRRDVTGDWQTAAELASDAISVIDTLPGAGDYQYKVIALNDGVPSAPTGLASLTADDGAQVALGAQLFATNCAGCHGDGGEGTPNFPALNTPRDVEAMIDYITVAMPLGNADACDRACAEAVAAFIQTLWVDGVTCSLRDTPVSYGARQLKILTRSEYQNSVEDVLGVDYPAAQGLSEDSKVGFFLNNTQAAMVANSYSNYLLVAEGIAQWSAERDFAPALSCASYDQDCADLFLSTVVPKLFRRALTADEAIEFLALANGSFTSGDVKAGIEMALEAVLSSPQFLYRHELGEPNPDNPLLAADGFELTSAEMATFLAYTFTGSTPDDTLLNLAAADALRTQAQISAQVARLVPTSDAVLGRFVGSWLGTEDLDQAAKDPAVWADFEQVVPHMQREIEQVFAHVMLDPDEQFGTLFNANFTFLNQPLAEHYGIAGISGDDFQQVFTTDRGGILASGAFMARWGEAVETSPILRSVRVRRRMLCQPLPDPPAGTFEAREEKLAELADLLQDPTTTNRLKYHRLTEDFPCTNCHTEYINPMGFGMEDFDTVGRVRSEDLNGNAIDASGALYAPINYGDLDQNIPFTGARGLGATLAGLESAQTCLTKQMFRYVVGVGHDSVDASNPEGPQLSVDEMAGYACELDTLDEALTDRSPRAMLARFGLLEAIRYRKAWTRD